MKQIVLAALTYLIAFQAQAQFGEVIRRLMPDQEITNRAGVGAATGNLDIGNMNIGNGSNTGNEYWNRYEEPAIRQQSDKKQVRTIDSSDLEIERGKAKSRKAAEDSASADLKRQVEAVERHIELQYRNQFH